MNNNEVKNVENKQNNSLMRKTKVQLVEIILRKDSIEKNLRDDIANTKIELNKVKTEINMAQCDYSRLKSDYSKLKSDYSRLDSDHSRVKSDYFKLDSDYSSLDSDYLKLDSDYFKLKSDYINMCDMCKEKTLVESELKNTINKQRGFIWFLVIMFVISITANIALYLI